MARIEKEIEEKQQRLRILEQETEQRERERQELREKVWGIDIVCFNVTVHLKLLHHYKSRSTIDKKKLKIDLVGIK